MQCFSLKISPYRILVDVLRFPGASSEESTWNVGAQVWSPGPEDPLEKEMATYSSILDWKSHGQRIHAAGAHRVAKEADKT